MPEIDEEDLDELDYPDSDDDLPEYEDEEYDDLETDEELEEEASPRVAPRNRQQPSQVIAELQAQIQTLTDERNEWRRKHGEAVRTLGEKAKAAEDKFYEWAENVRKWQETEVAREREEAFQQGVASVEKHLLDSVMPEVERDYLRAKTRGEFKPTPSRTPLVNPERPKRVSDASEDINTLVAEAIADGVPEDRIDQTSASSVVASVGRYWREENKRVLDEKRETESALEVRTREANGAARVSTGNGAPRPPAKSSLQKQLDEINRQLAAARKTSNVNRATELIYKKRELEARLARADR